jgi:Bacterial regulatory proteins, gntR family
MVGMRRYAADITARTGAGLPPGPARARRHHLAVAQRPRLRAARVDARVSARSDAAARSASAILRAAIALGDDDMLPSESQLQAQQGVSRSAVRLAIATLESERLVRTIHLRGAFMLRRC